MFGMVKMNYYNEIKNILIDNSIGRKVREYKSNQKDLESYYNVGKLLVEAQGGEERAKYGNELMKEYSKKLTNELGKGYSVRMLQKMRQFYLLTQRSPPLAAKFKSINITWSNICEIMQLKNLEEIEYYLNLSNKLCLTKLELRTKIKSKEYERLDSKIREKLVKQEEVSVKDKIPDPIVLEGLEYKEKLTEKVVQKWIDENPASFCKSLGEGYTYCGSQYKIKIGANYNYIDVLLFNVMDMNYVVVEIKVTEIKKEHIGQIQTYMNYIDINLKKEFHNKTTGILLVRENNKWLIKYINGDDVTIRNFITSSEC
jgi:predicted nuclease of restriction endonuclease-like (RecB) superfamily